MLQLLFFKKWPRHSQDAAFGSRVIAIATDGPILSFGFWPTEIQKSRAYARR